MKTKSYRVTVKETKEERDFLTLEEIKEWAARATITFQCDLTLDVIEVVETKTVFSANYNTGEVKEAT